jgi:hypothetical protein
MAGKMKKANKKARLYIINTYDFTNVMIGKG